MRRCKCFNISNPDFYNGMLIKLKIGEIYLYDIYMEIEDRGEGNWVENWYYSIYTLDNIFVMGGFEKDFYDKFIDLNIWRKEKIRKLNETM